MKLLLLHLSDIHVKSAEDSVLVRAKKIAEATYRYLSDVHSLVIIISGDIAYSGLEEEYIEAERLVTSIIEDISNESDVVIHVIVVPGNHDCNFQHVTSVRNAVIKTMIEEGEGGIDNERISVCLEVQKEFEAFRNKVETSSPINNDPLWRQHSIDINGIRMCIDCLNVAWISEKNETQGNLFFPVKRFQNMEDVEQDLRIVVLHHPLNWYNQSTYHDFRTLIRGRGDFVITGHEHVQSVGEIDDAHSQVSVYIEGAALQSDTESDRTGFNIVSVDLENQQYNCDLWWWSGDSYQKEDLVSSWSSYRSLPSRRSNEFRICDEFMAILREPGANFSHPAKQALMLSDIYIYPDIEEIVEDGKDNRLIDAKFLQNPSAFGDGVIIKGEESSGKTSLLRMLFCYYHEAGYVPILIDAREISSASKKELESLINKGIKRQFCDKAIEEWKKLEKNRKILLIDNFDNCKVKDIYRHEIITFANKNFFRVLITTDLMADIREVISVDIAEVFGDYKHYEMKSFGYKLRGELIKKWVRLDEKQTDGAAELLGKVDGIEKIINTVLDKNLVPRVPFYLLTLLQSLESAFPADLQSSALGHYYHYLITQSLGKAKVHIEQLEEIFGYCSNLAWFFCESKCEEVEKNNLRLFNGVYSKEFIFIDLEPRLALLCEAKILSKRGDYYSFYYPYVYFYFLGKYLSNQMSENQEVQIVIRRYCSHLYVRDYANTILFLIHHSKDRFIIDCILENIRSLFSDKKPLCLEDDSSGINELVESTTRLVFSGGDPETNRREKREASDRDESKLDNKTEINEEKDGELDLPAKLNALFKTTDILGQILKNYYGTLRNELKKEIMREIYTAPLRALREFIEVIEESREALIWEVDKAIKDRDKDNKLSEDKRKKFAKRILFEVIGMYTFGFLYKSSSAVGSEYLRDVAREIVDEDKSTAFQLIELGTLLDSPTELPFEGIQKLAKLTENNILPHRILEAIVLRHLYLFKTTDMDKQKICSVLGVPMKYQRAIDIKTKDKKMLIE